MSPKSISTWVIVGAIASLGTMFMLSGAATTQPSSRTATQPATQLERRTGAMILRGASFESAINSLQLAGQRPIFVNWDVLEKARATKDLPVTIDLSDRSIDEALTTLLDHVGGTQVSLGHQLDKGTIVVSTSNDLAANLWTTVYDIRAAITNDASRAEDVEAVAQRVRGLDPLSWKAAGGPIGSIRELDGHLIVTQTQRVHAQIVQALHDVLPKDAAGK
ncbi:MAG TPA: hypothetical protein VGN72_01620 [Tepidisphaeraceae bacterium]|jgi:hypothetical protein|nr:hypothetical protein [Tepidisphaeraceae bacterium]